MYSRALDGYEQSRCPQCEVDITGYRELLIQCASDTAVEARLAEAAQLPRPPTDAMVYTTTTAKVRMKAGSG